MKRNENIEEVLQRALPSASRAQMETALDRVLTRLRASRGETVPDPLAQFDSPRADEPVSPKRESGLVPSMRRGESNLRGRRRTAIALSAAAALMAIAAWIGIPGRDQDMYAVLEAADGPLYRIADGDRVPIRVGDRIRAEQTIQSTDSAGAVLALADGSRVEMRAKSELSWDEADEGLAVRLNAGSIIINAAKQPSSRLYVQTRDMTASVGGTISVVNAEQNGSRVAVIDGEVRVRELGTPLRRSGRHGTAETRLRPGEQVATSPTLAARALKEDIAWSRYSDAYRTILASFQKGMAETAAPLPSLTGRSASGKAASQTVAAAARQEFEEASIRPCDPDNLPPAPPGARGGGANSLQMTPGRLHALCLTPATLVRTALGYSPANINPGGRLGRGMNFNAVYGLGVEDGLRVRGGPDWVRNEYYTIEAVAGTAADAETLRGPMLRVLLEKRFGLKFHIETEQIPAFALTVVPGGFKLKEGTCTPPDPSQTPQAGAVTSTANMVRRNLDAARRGATTQGPCGFAGAANGPNLIFVGAGAGVPPLGGFLGVPVIDRTGIPTTARFNYVLEFKPDETTPGPLGGIPPLPQAQIAADPSAVPPAPPLRTVLEEQFGLRLEPAQAPREYIVIDAIQRPGGN